MTNYTSALRRITQITVPALAACALGFTVQPAGAKTKPITAKSTSSFAYVEKHGGKSVEITNVTFDVTTDHLPGRAEGDRLVLRTTVHSSWSFDEAGMDSKVTVEAWTLGSDLGKKPVYTVALDGVGATTADNGILTVERGTEDVDWWTVHGLGTGAALFDTYVPVTRFSITSPVQTMRYAGLEVPPDDAKDERLREPHVVGVLIYAAADGVKREGLITCDDDKRAQLLRSYFDETRTLTAAEAGAAAAADGSADATPRPMTLELTWTANVPPGPADAVSARIPVSGDDLDLAGAQLPPCFHIAAWKR